MIIWKKEERLERKLKMKDKKLKKSKSPKLMSLHPQESTKSICMNSKKKLFHSDMAGTLNIIQIQF